MGFGSLVGVDEDGLDAEPAGPVNIPDHVVTHADHLGRQELHGVEGLHHKPRIRFPESVIRGDNDRVEVTDQSHRFHLRQGVTGLRVRNKSSCGRWGAARPAPP